MDTIMLTNEEGMEEEFYIVATFGVDDYNYAALEPVEEEGEIYIFRMDDDQDSEELLLTSIEDEEEFKNAVEVLEELLEEDLQ